MLHKTNQLANSTSPYLLQHQYNPVNWFPWSDEALQKSIADDKLIIVSIGYSTCHWCHVMEHESFENDEVAALMNEHFISIKVDREERPDIDQIYMEAVQLMTGGGGWPLNCVLLPNKQAIFGGTYFPRHKWMDILKQLHEFYKNDKVKSYQYAQELTDGIQQLDFKVNSSADFRNDFNEQKLIENWSLKFDHENGGMLRAPKFPMPDNYRYLLNYAARKNDLAISTFVKLTLLKMYFGGIYDHLDGGFAWYSTDMEWKIPHFEKMLYDNAQMLSLYAEAYTHFNDTTFKDVITGIIDFLNNKLKNSDGAFYSAIDADSEGEEGKYYVWIKDDLKEFSADEIIFLNQVYHVFDIGIWEEGKSVLMRTSTNDELSNTLGLPIEIFNDKLSSLNKKLLSIRNLRISPGIDTKIICSWNALCLKGMCDAYKIIQTDELLEQILKLADYFEKYFINVDNSLNRISSNDNVVLIKAFLDDYACMIEAFIAVHTITFKEKYLLIAKKLCDYVLINFNDVNADLLFYTDANAERLIARKKELQDNVISSSNAIMAENLFLLSRYFDLNEYFERAQRMVAIMDEEITTHTPWYSRWSKLKARFNNKVAELVICGDIHQIKMNELYKNYLPFLIISGCNYNTDLPLTKFRFIPNEVNIYICIDNTCHLPVNNMKDALNILNNY